MLNTLLIECNTEFCRLINKSFKTEAEQAAELLKLVESMSNQNPAIIQMLTQALSQQQFNSNPVVADSSVAKTNQSVANNKRLIPYLFDSSKNCILTVCVKIIIIFRPSGNESKKLPFIELEMPMNLDDKFESYLVSAHSDWDQTFVSKQ